VTNDKFPDASVLLLRESVLKIWIRTEGVGLEILKVKILNGNLSLPNSAILPIFKDILFNKNGPN
jgi:hypothetical protein